MNSFVATRGFRLLPVLQSTATFDIDLLKVEQLELRVYARDKNSHCHAVWLDPMLTVSGGFVVFVGSLL